MQRLGRRRSRPHARPPPSPPPPPRPRPHRLVRPPRKTLDSDSEDEHYLSYAVRQRPRLGTAPTHPAISAGRVAQDDWMSNPNLSIVTR